VGAEEGGDLVTHGLERPAQVVVVEQLGPRRWSSTRFTFAQAARSSFVRRSMPTIPRSSLVIRASFCVCMRF
jgi:hypothetical protein